MVLHKTGLLAALSVGVSLVACASGFAMAPASTGPGLSAGAEIGAQLTGGTTFSAAGDANYGLKTNLLNQPYTDLFVDDLYVGRKFGGSTVNINLLGLGVRQPLPIGGSTPIAIEGGFSNLNFTNGGGSDSGGFIGGRISLAQGSSVGIHGMVRYHFLPNDDSLIQAGLGLTGPLGKGSGLYYQADYYHTSFTSGGSDSTDTILVGIRDSFMTH